MVLIKALLGILIGFSAGVVISGAIFAFISKLGIVPRLAQKTNTMEYIKLYEETIIVGGILGTLYLIVQGYLPIGKFLVVIYCFSAGIFCGVLAVSLAEILDVIPILSRRAKLQRGMFYFISAIAIGKFIGSILYFSLPGFFVP